MKLNTGPQLVDVDGMLVDADCLRIAEAVKAYDENLEILCTVNAADISDAPYVLAELCRDGQYRKIMDVWELDDRVLEAVEAADSQRHDLIAVINGRNERVKKDRERRYKDLSQETHEIAVSVLRTQKSRYTAPDPRTGESITFYDDRPAVRNEAEQNRRQF